MPDKNPYTISKAYQYEQPIKQNIQLCLIPDQLYGLAYNKNNI